MAEIAVHILGAGVAYPDAELSNQFLGDIGLVLNEPSSALLGRFGVTSRRTSLPVDYLRSTKNGSVVDGRSAALSSPTDLGFIAAQQALSRAGISPEQIGLIVADTGTQYQTCPSEAQRIGGRFNLKVAAFDFDGGAGSFSLYLETLKNWKADKVPDYVLCVSTNTPSQHVDYASPSIEPYVFGDAASAFVLSRKVPGRLQLVDSYLRRHGPYKASTTIDRNIVLSIDNVLPRTEVTQLMSQGIQRLKERHALALDTAIFIGPQLFAGDVTAFCSEIGMAPHRVIQPTISRGYSLGSATGAALAEVWDTIEEKQQIIVLHAGDGLWSGSVLLASK